MGCNYYLCGQERQHIGKLSHGWCFCFRGYEGFPRSWQDWQKLLRQELARGGYIESEDEDLIKYQDFVTLVESHKEGLNHVTYCKAWGMEDGWLDDEGHPFTDKEFC